MNYFKKHIYKPTILMFLPVLYSVLSFSQDAKGIKPNNNLDTEFNGKTRALIIGISKYQYIDSLNYAHRDAELFANYLLESKFWGIEKENLTLLLNEKAKNADLITQLYLIVQRSNPGDKFIFYFSGHGDVETITDSKNGYLLTHNTFNNLYPAGALSVNDLRDVIVTLLKKPNKVLLITDACKSGKLAGGEQGAKYTSASLSTIWNNEIKFLSTQSTHLSYEDKKWGNGQGVFSYYLIKGLSGEADLNKDSLITVAELDNYVGSLVTSETNSKQQPFIHSSNKFSTVITRVLPVAKNAHKSGGNFFNQKLKNIVLPVDSCNYYYSEMKKAINEKKFLPHESVTATQLYLKLKSCTSDSNLIFNANSELLSALMNSSQEIFNNSFIGQSLLSEDDYRNGIELINQALEHNDLQLPVNGHLNNIKRYLRVLGQTHYKHSPVTETSELDLLIDSAIKEEPDAAYLLMAKAAVEMEKENLTFAIKLLEKALLISPGWLMPKYYLGICYSKKKSYSRALAYYEEVLKKDTTYRTFECTKCLLESMAEWSLELKKYDKVVEYSFKSIELFPEYVIPYNILYDYALEKRDTATAHRLVEKLYHYNDTIFFRFMRIRFEQEFFNKSMIPSLDTARLLLKDNIDSADYYYSYAFYLKNELLISLNDDYSIIYYFTKAADLDYQEIFYLQSLLDYLEAKEKEDMWYEIEEIILERIDRYEAAEKLILKDYLLYSYFNTDQDLLAFPILKELHEAGFISCKEINEKDWKKFFKNTPGFSEYLKKCTDK